MSETDQLKAVAAALEPKPRPTNAMLSERARTHGPFEENARISQDLKHYVYAKANPPPSAVHREALDMICVEISRILSGQPDYKGHWDKIASYAKLASAACQKQSS